jgi:hypothetical protein
MRTREHATQIRVVIPHNAHEATTQAVTVGLQMHRSVRAALRQVDLQIQLMLFELTDWRSAAAAAAALIIASIEKLSEDA